jgi:predicted nicotinamide N-methyase
MKPSTQSVPKPQLSRLRRRLRRTLPDARLDINTLPGCRGLKLALINADYPQGPLHPDVMRAVIHEPAYWSFCWGSGLALAQHLLTGKEDVRDKSVLDLGSGSGVAGIAAAMAGARRVIACDIDADARLATVVNAGLNGVAVEVIHSLDQLHGPVDLVLLADVLYDHANFGLIDLAKKAGRHVLIADSRIRELARDDFVEFAEREARTLPNLGEFDEFRVVRFFGSK